MPRRRRRPGGDVRCGGGGGQALTNPEPEESIDVAGRHTRDTRLQSHPPLISTQMSLVFEPVSGRASAEVLDGEGLRPPAVVAAHLCCTLDE